MQASKQLTFIITTMDGVPVTKDDWSLMTYPSTQSMRDNAKHLTFTTKTRHHTRWLPKDKWFKAKKHYEKEGFIPLGFLE
jgi:hypothetical protein